MSKKIPKRHPMQPMRPMNAYMLFSREVTPSLRIQDPKANAVSLLTKVAQMWKDLPSESKSKYEEPAQKAKLKYEEDMKAFQEAYPEHSLLNRGLGVAHKKEAKQSLTLRRSVRIQNNEKNKKKVSN